MDVHRRSPLPAPRGPAPRDAVAAAPGPDGPDPAVVLLVDDDPLLLQGLRRGLHHARDRWRTVTATSGEEALQALAHEPVDVVVCDLWIRTTTGVQLLTEIRRLHPQAARIVLTGYTDWDAIVKAVGPAQQVLTKPCTGEDLLAVLDRVAQTRRLIEDPALRDLLGGLESLPAPPGVYRRINEITADPDYRLADVLDVISSDLGTVTEVLRLANSTSLGLPGRVDSLHRAVTLLGLPTVQALAVAGAAQSGVRPVPGLDPAARTRHGMQVGGLARYIAQAERWPSTDVGDVFMAGLLHDIGLAVLAAANPAGWSAARAAEPSGPGIGPAHELYTRHLGCPPTRASAYLLGLWGFPQSVIRTLADQPSAPDDPATTLEAQLLTYARQRVAGGAAGSPEDGPGAGEGPGAQDGPGPENPGDEEAPGEDGPGGTRLHRWAQSAQTYALAGD